MKKSQRTSLYIGIIILILLLAGISFYQRSIGEPYVATDIQQAQTEDFDNDGLKDWEEVLWKTKANDPDTDKDGTPDGLEVALGRDPIVAGPDDFLEGVVFTHSQTDDVALGILGSYFNSVNTESGNKSDTSEEILQKTLTSQGQKPFVITYSLSNIKQRGSELSDYKQYGNDLAGLFRYFENSPDELAVVLTAIQTNNPEDLNPLDTIVENYRLFLSGLLNTSVPYEIADEHLATINAISQIIADINGMKLIYEDAVSGTQNLSDYLADAPVVQNALAALIIKVRESGVEYSTDEIGYGLVNVL